MEKEPAEQDPYDPQYFHKERVRRLLKDWERLSTELTYNDKAAFEANQYNKHRLSWFNDVAEETRFILEEDLVKDPEKKLKIEKALEDVEAIINQVLEEKSRRKRGVDQDVMTTPTQIDKGDELLRLLRPHVTPASELDPEEREKDFGKS